MAFLFCLYGNIGHLLPASKSNRFIHELAANSKLETTSCTLVSNLEYTHQQGAKLRGLDEVQDIVENLHGNGDDVGNTIGAFRISDETIIPHAWPEPPAPFITSCTAEKSRSPNPKLLAFLNAFNLVAQSCI